MASPQVENGYTRIANEIMEKLISAGLNGTELAVTLFILRKTYGYQKLEDEISISQFLLAIPTSKQSLCSALKTLQLVKIIRLVKKGKSKLCSNLWSFNKDYDTWQLVKKTRLVKKTIKQLVKKTRHTKETITKEILSQGDEQLNKDVKAIIDYWFIKWQKVFNQKPQVAGAKFTVVSKPIIKAHGIEKAKRVCDVYFSTDDEFFRKQSWGFMTMMSSEIFNSLLTKI
jgi:phage replication O-like protein O